MSGAPTPRLPRAASSGSPIVIRTYEPRDNERVWDLHEEGLRDTGTLIGAYRRDLHPDLASIEEWYMRPGGCFWVAEAGGQPVGMVGIEIVDPTTARLRQLRVTAEWRQQGIGRLLVETPERFCRERGYRRLILDTNALQTAAHRLYERAGFTRTGERTRGPSRVFDYEKHLA